MATKTEIGTDVLEKLGAIGAGETPDTVDQSTADNAYDAVYQELRSRMLVDWGSTEDIPAWARLHVVDIVANRISNRYGVPRQPDEEELAFTRMAKHIAVDLDGEPTRANFY